MQKIRIAITGQNGFIGSHLYRKAAVDTAFRCVEFPRGLFERPEQMREVLTQTDAVVHLAGLSRHADGEFLYRTNVGLVQKLISVCSGSQILYLGSTTHDAKEAPYHRSKRESARLFQEYGNCGILRMTNTFGPGSLPFYNSVVSTFCKMAAEDKVPEKIDDVMLPLIYVDDLCREILNAVKEHRTGMITINQTFEYPLKKLWLKLNEWKNTGKPQFESVHEIELYMTFKSYL